MLSFFLRVIFFIVVLDICGAHRDGTHEKMYKDLDTNAACFRRLNGTHQFGCSSSRRGNTGIIHIIETKENLTEFLKNSTSENYVIALNMKIFTNEIVNQLLIANNIAGVLLIVQKTLLPGSFSPDDTCPNSRMDSCGGHIINPYSNGFLFIDWPFPMFMVDDESTIKTIYKCFHDFNLPFGESQLSRPLCSVQIKSHMSASVNTPTCLRRESEAGARVFKYCDPMGDRNIILPLLGTGETLSPKSAIVIAARLDTATIFDGVSSGYITAATSIVTLLSTANVLSKLLKDEEIDDKEVIFILFNGEAQDYIGSSRMIYDIKNANFLPTTSLNLTLENIMAFIELSQIDSSPQLYLHSTKDSVINNIELNLISTGSKYSLRYDYSSLNRIPPSSFLIFRKADPSIPGVVISNYDEQYTNKYFNGFLDNSMTLSYNPGENELKNNIAKVAISVASSVHKALTNSSKPIDEEEVGQLVDDLLQCYLLTKFCKLMKVVSPSAESSAPTSPWPMYVSVQPSTNPITTTTGLLLAYLTSTPVNKSEDSCSTDSNSYSYYWINGPNNSGMCLNSTLKFTPALSPAFLIENYDWTSGNYSTWTESIWFDFGVQVFLKPSRKKEWITFSIGLSVLVISFFSVYWLNKKAKEIFSNSHTNCSLLTTNC